MALAHPADTPFEVNSTRISFLLDFLVAVFLVLVNRVFKGLFALEREEQPEKEV